MILCELLREAFLAPGSIPRSFTKTSRLVARGFIQERSYPLNPKNPVDPDEPLV
jgi:hypothetical protein